MPVIMSRKIADPGDTTSLLPLRNNWVHEKMTSKVFASMCLSHPHVRESNLPIFPGLSRSFTLNHHCSNEIANKPSIKGWPRPGPGSRVGMRRIPMLSSLEGPLIMALCSLVRDSISMFQEIPFGSIPARFAEREDEMKLLRGLIDLEKTTDVYPSIRKKMWTLSQQLGVPSFLMKVNSYPYALGMYLVPSEAGFCWHCSICIQREVDIHSRCEHSSLSMRCLEAVATKLQLSMEHVIDMLNRHAEFMNTTESHLVSFYGNRSKLEFAVVRSDNPGGVMKCDKHSRVHVVRGNDRWLCLARSCHGISHLCVHSQIVRSRIGCQNQTGNVRYTPSMFEGGQPGSREGQQERSSRNSQFVRARYSRPMIPSDRAFQIDLQVNTDARTGTERCIPASQKCHCGQLLARNTVQRDVHVSALRIEASRCFTSYKQGLWRCGNGHLVLPEDDDGIRDGMVWVSKDTAYTEVFLFDVLLHVTFAGSSIASQCHIRMQLLSLQFGYGSGQSIPRSTISIRHALLTYAKSVVKGIPDWVFRCEKCSHITDQGVHYDKLSFDGQQLGFNIRHDVEYDFYGKRYAAWTKPVVRCTDAWRISHVIEVSSLRGIVIEALRVRELPVGCNSVYSACRVMMNVSLQGVESIRSAVAAVKLFDPVAAQYVNSNGTCVVETSLVDFLRTYDAEEFAHPFPLISSTMSEMAMRRGKAVTDLFRFVFDARKAAGMLSVLLNNLRSDLKKHIPRGDRQFIDYYASLSYDKLQAWLLEYTTPHTPPTPPQTLKNLMECVGSGIAEYVPQVVHPYRPPWSWVYNPDYPSQEEGYGRSSRVCEVLVIGFWKCPIEAETRVLLMVMAILNEPVSVWMREGELKVIHSAREVLLNAEQYCGSGNLSFHYRAAFQELKSCAVLYEGIMGVIGADMHQAMDMYYVLRRIFEVVNEKYALYEEAIDNTVCEDESRFSPSGFDEMLRRTGAISSDTARSFMASNISPLEPFYGEQSRIRSSDVLQTGVYAPDFPVRRPCPFEPSKGSEANRAEMSCSKDYKVHSAFSPGTFGAYCLCKHVKTVALMFLKRPEGCRMPLNFIVERCATLPKYVVYDFACGTQKSALGMSKELVRNVNFVIDPFHFPGHRTCSLAMHQSSYSELLGRNTESQEQRNKSIKIMERTLRGCLDVHYIHIVILAHGYLNLKSMFMDNHDIRVFEWGSRAWLRWVRDVLFPSKMR